MLRVIISGLTRRSCCRTPAIASVRRCTAVHRLGGRPAAVALTRLLQSVLCLVSSTDALVFLTFASGVPALRASRIDPSQALRAQ